MRDAAFEGIALIFPDTSPRGAGIEGEDNNWDFGTGKIQVLLQYIQALLVSLVGAGFYLNATNPMYSRHYNMLTHVTMELPQIIEAAGLPIVSIWLSPVFTSSKTRNISRTSNASHSLATQWVDMGL
jgi:S-formylglutathione hydrolase